MIIFSAERFYAAATQHRQTVLEFSPKLRFIHTYNVTQWGTQNMGVKQQLFNI